MDISIVIPCFNEIDNINKIKDELIPVVTELAQSYSTEIIFVDDGSTDGTIAGLQRILADVEKPNLVIKYADNHGNWGLGKAVRTGFEASTGEIIVTTDSDGTYKFVHIKDLLAYLVPGVDVVTASPYHPQGDVVGVPQYRLILSQGSSFIYRILLNWNIHTYTCLFRAYRRKVIQDVSFVSNSFMSGTEILVKCMLKGYKVVEYPAVLYRRTFGVSKARLLKTILAHLRFQATVLLHQLHLTSLVAREGSNNNFMLIKTKYSIN
jgi:dolichol-phosphate mannosyltransferase